MYDACSRMRVERERVAGLKRREHKKLEEEEESKLKCTVCRESQCVCEGQRVTLVWVFVFTFPCCGCQGLN